MTNGPEILNFAPIEDARGSLLPIEFADVPFTVRRVFVVTGPLGGATRGDHAVACAELLCLVDGRAVVQLGDDHTTLGEPVVLVRPGQSVLVAPGTFVRYSLADASSVLLVLAEEPHSGGHRE